MAKSRSPFAKLPFAPIVGAMFAAVAGILVGATPYWLLSRTVAASGLAAIVPAFNPPLGDTARIALMIAAAIITGLVAFILALIAERTMAKPKQRAVSRGMTITVSERGVHSGHADGRIRPPLFADAELGAPLMSDEAYERAKDELILDVPLAEADLDLPLWVEDVATEPAPDEQAMKPGPTAVMIELPAEPAVEAPPETAPVPTASVAASPIAALMDRLEQGIARRPHGMPPLRNLGRTRAGALLRG